MVRNRHVVGGSNGADVVSALGVEARLRQDVVHLRLVRAANLDDTAQLFIEERGRCWFAEGIQVELQSAPASKGHLEHSRYQAAIRTIVIGKQETLRAQHLDGTEKGDHLFRVVQVGDWSTNLPLALGQRTATHAASTLTQVKQYKARVAAVTSQGGGGRCADVGHRGKGRDDE